MLYEGTVKGGVVVLAGDPLPDGTRVRVEPLPADVATPIDAAAPASEPTLGQRLMKFAGRARGLPPDAARNHDHYLYGTPKR